GRRCPWTEYGGAGMVNERLLGPPRVLRCHSIRRTDAAASSRRARRRFTDGFWGKAWLRRSGAAGAIFCVPVAKVLHRSPSSCDCHGPALSTKCGRNIGGGYG